MGQNSTPSFRSVPFRSARFRSVPFRSTPPPKSIRSVPFRHGTERNGTVTVPGTEDFPDIYIYPCPGELLGPLGFGLWAPLYVGARTDLSKKNLTTLARAQFLMYFHAFSYILFTVSYRKIVISPDLAGFTGPGSRMARVQNFRQITNHTASETMAPMR